MCPRCGYTRVPTKKDAEALRFVTKLEHPKLGSSTVALDIPPDALMRHDVTCPSCGHRGVYYWRRQVSGAESSDELERVWKCPACGYEWVERE